MPWRASARAPTPSAAPSSAPAGRAAPPAGTPVCTAQPNPTYAQSHLCAIPLIRNPTYAQSHSCAIPRRLVSLAAGRAATPVQRALSESACAHEYGSAYVLERAHVCVCVRECVCVCVRVGARSNALAPICGRANVCLRHCICACGHCVRCANVCVRHCICICAPLRQGALYLGLGLGLREELREPRLAPGKLNHRLSTS